MTAKTILKPWGEEVVIHEEGAAIFKRLSIKMGESLSLQYHHEKSEFLVCVKGTAVVEVQLTHKDSDFFKLSEGESLFIYKKTIHRIKANTDCEILELAAGTDADIVRIADKYGRI